MSLFVWNGSQWRSITDVWVRDGSQWRSVVEAWAWDGSQWRLVFSAGSPLPQPPNAPSGASATMVGTTPRVSWTDNSVPPNQATSFDVEASVNGGGFGLVGTPAASPFDHTGAPGDSQLQYRVRARNAGGTSGYSNTTGSVYTTPNAPSGLTATAVSQSAINLSWSINSVVQSSQEIHRSTTSGFSPGPSTLIDTVGAGATSYSDSGLSPETTYFYRVIAVNPSGLKSAPSNQASATTFAPPPAPGILNPQLITNSQAKTARVRFDVSLGTESVFIEYQLTYLTDSGSVQLPVQPLQTLNVTPGGTNIFSSEIVADDPDVLGASVEFFLTPFSGDGASGTPGQVEEVSGPIF